MRSQMAEGLARTLARPGSVEVRSGGTQPAGFVHPAGIRAMREREIDISGHTSKTIDVEFARRADAFITLCGPLDDSCPRALAQRAVEWPTPDPSWGTDDDVRKIRDQLERRIAGLLAEWGVLREDARVRA